MRVFVLCVELEFPVRKPDNLTRKLSICNRATNFRGIEAVAKGRLNYLHGQAQEVAFGKTFFDRVKTRLTLVIPRWRECEHPHAIVESKLENGLKL
jgi:hypothetical protein